MPIDQPISSQFKNAPSGPVGLEESRKRIQELINSGATGTPITKNIGGQISSKPVKLARGVEERTPKKYIPEEAKTVISSDESVGDSEVVNYANEKIVKNNVPVADIKSSVPEIIYEPSDVKYWDQTWKSIYREGVLHGDVEKVILEVTLPQDNEIEVSAAEQMYASLAGLTQKPGKVFDLAVGVFPQIEILFKNDSQSLSFEIFADEAQISFRVIIPKEWQDYVERQIHGAYPDAEISEIDSSTFYDGEGVIMVNELELKGKIYYPIRVAEEFGTDPLNALTSVVSKLSVGEKAMVQFLTQPADDVWRKRGQRFVQLAQSPAKDGEKKASVDPAVLEAVSQKVSRPGYRVVVRIMVHGRDEISAQTTMNSIVGSFDQYSLPHLAVFSNKKVVLKEKTINEILSRTFPKWGNYPILNSVELATIYHFPNIEVKTPRIKWLRTRTSAPPTNLPTEGIHLGDSIYRHEKVSVRLQREDRRRHMYTIGQTGSGKSEFLKYLAYQDIINGEGLAFIDPHGEAVEELLTMIPKERAEDVVYFNPADSSRPMGINILEAQTEEQKHQAVNSFISLLYKLYDPNRTGIVGPQLERAVRNVMLTAMSETGNTLIEVLKLLTNPAFAEKKIKLIDDPMVKSYWTEQIAQTADAQKSETLGYFVSKFDRFVTEKLMRNIIGQSKSAFSFRDIMDNKKIFLANLSKGKIGEENSTFLGLLLVPRILVAAMSRADLPPDQRKDFYLYVDEFQNFSTPDFAQILAEARKYKLNLIVANQYIAQIQDDIRNAVFGNVGTMCSFRIGADDAEYMEKQFEPVFTQRDLINLGIGEVGTRLLIDGQPTRPFSFKTDWPAIQGIPRNEKMGEIIKEISRLKYGRVGRVVESEIAVRAEF